MSSSSCPNLQDLRSYLRGTLADAPFLVVSDHLEQCSDCEQRLADLEDVGPVIRVEQPQVDGIEDEYQSLQRNLLNWSRQKTSLPLGQVDNDTSSDAPRPGDRIGQYRLIEQLGRGAMGVVFLAEHTSLKRWVALKLLASHLLQHPDAHRRFRREMEAVGRTDHPNLIHATDAGEMDGQSFLAMDYVPGADVESICRTLGPLPIADASEIVYQAAQGLAHAHNHGLIHRDVKPSNLLLGVDGGVRLLDLGLALFQQDDALPVAEIVDESLVISQHDDQATRAGTVLGTRAYMAPEQKIDSHVVDATADVYGLGATLHRILYGSPPSSVLLQQTTHERFVSWQSLRGDVPAPILELLSSMLHVDPLQRPPLNDVGHQLRAFRNSTDWFHFVNTVRTKGLASRELPRPSVVPTGVPILLDAGQSPADSSWPLADHPESSTTARASSAVAPLAFAVGGLGCLTVVVSLVVAVVIIGMLDNSLPSPPLAKGSFGGPVATETTETYRSPRIGAPALRLAATDSIELRDTAYLVGTGESFTVDMWVKPRSGHHWDSTLLSSSATGGHPGLAMGQSGWTLSLSDSPIRQNWELTVGGRHSMGGQPWNTASLVADEWHHIALVRSGHQWKLWVDGRLQHSTTSIPSPTLNRQRGGNLRLGSTSTLGPSLGMDMDVAALRVTEGSLYNTTFKPEFPLQPDDGTVALMDFKTKNSRQLQDLMNEGHTGKLSGGTWVQVE